VGYGRLGWKHKKLILNSFVLNNDGYTVERLIHGKDAEYNKVPYLDYGALAKALGPDFPPEYYGPVKTCEELTNLLDNETLAKAERFQVSRS